MHVSGYMMFNTH